MKFITGLGGIFLLVVFLYTLKKIYLRLLISFSKKKGLVGHRKLAARIFTKIPSFSLDKNTILTLDSPSKKVLQKRLEALKEWEQKKHTKYKESQSLFEQALQHYPDTGLINHVAIPFIFKPLKKFLPPSSLSLVESSYSHVKDIDNNQYIDLGNSLSNNLWGYQETASDLSDAIQTVQKTGAILSNYNALTKEVIQQICTFAKKDFASFHMSGTEAVMQACRIARYHTQKKRIVLFTGCYHGWADTVQIYPENLKRGNDTLQLKQENQLALKCIQSRKDIAGILINPLHILFPNKMSPSDSLLISSRVTPPIDSERIRSYTNWLHQLKQISIKKNIALIFDEVYIGTRLGWGGAQTYFNTKADIAVYGKAFGCGLPNGIVTYQAHYGKRTKTQRPLHNLTARGTFQGNPYVLAAINTSIKKMKDFSEKGDFQTSQQLFKNTIKEWNQEFKKKSIPLSISHFESICTMNYLLNSPFNWLFPFYLKDEGIHFLAYPGTGRFTLNLNLQPKQLNNIFEAICRASTRMKNDQFWTQETVFKKRTVLKKCLQSFFN